MSTFEEVMSEEVMSEEDPIDRKIEEAMEQEGPKTVTKHTAQVIRPKSDTLADVLAMVLVYNREVLSSAKAINFRRMPDHPEFPTSHVWHLEVI